MAARGKAPVREFTAEVYKAAALEHMPVASELYDAGHYVLATYVAGLATEAILRAYRCRIDPEFDARHDLTVLWRASKFADIVPADRASEYDAHLNTVAAQWSNAHRYRSERSLRAYYKRTQLDRSVRKGDFLKELTRRAVHAATALVTLGAQRWPT